MFARLRRLPLRTKNKVSIIVALVLTTCIALASFFISTLHTNTVTTIDSNVTQALDESKNMASELSARFHAAWTNMQVVLKSQKE